MKQTCKYFGIKYVSELKHYRGLEKAPKAIVDKSLSKQGRITILEKMYDLLRLVYEDSSNFAWIVTVLTNLYLLSWKPKPLKIINSVFMKLRRVLNINYFGMLSQYKKKLHLPQIIT